MIIPGNGTTITLMNKHLKPPQTVLKNSKKNEEMRTLIRSGLFQEKVSISETLFDRASS